MSAAAAAGSQLLHAPTRKHLKIVQASRLDLAAECLYPWTSGLEWDDPPGDAATFGTAVHACAEWIAEQLGEVGGFEDRALEELATAHAKAHELSDRDARRLLEHAKDIAELLSQEHVADRTAEIRIAYDPEAGTAIELAPGDLRPRNSVELRIDLLFRAGDTLVVRDWKTGKRPLIGKVEDSRQVQQYAVAIAKAFDVSKVRVELAWCSDRGIWIDHALLGGFELDAAEASIRQLHRRADDPGQLPQWGFHCRRCPVRKQCPAAAAAAEAVEVHCELSYPLASVPTAIIGEDHAREQLTRIELARAHLDACQAALELWTRKHGAIDLGDGTAWGPVQKPGRESVTCDDETVSVLEEHLGEHAELAVETTRKASKTSIERAAKEAARGKKRGTKKALLDAVHGALREAGRMRRGAPYDQFEAFRKEGAE